MDIFDMNFEWVPLSNGLAVASRPIQVMGRNLTPHGAIRIGNGFFNKIAKSYDLVIREEDSALERFMKVVKLVCLMRRDGSFVPTKIQYIDMLAELIAYVPFDRRYEPPYQGIFGGDWKMTNDVFEFTKKPKTGKDPYLIKMFKFDDNLKPVQIGTGKLPRGGCIRDIDESTGYPTVTGGFQKPIRYVDEKYPGFHFSEIGGDLCWEPGFHQIERKLVLTHNSNCTGSGNFRMDISSVYSSEDEVNVLLFKQM